MRCSQRIPSILKQLFFPFVKNKKKKINHSSQSNVHFTSFPCKKLCAFLSVERTQKHVNCQSNLDLKITIKSSAKDFKLCKFLQTLLSVLLFVKHKNKNKNKKDNKKTSSNYFCNELGAEGQTSVWVVSCSQIIYMGQSGRIWLSKIRVRGMR